MRRPPARRTWWLCALVLVATSACGIEARMSAEDARTFSRRALHHLALGHVTVERSVTPGRYQVGPPTGDIKIWITRSRVTRGTVVLYVPQRGDRAVYVSDVEDGGGQLLTEQQFDRLARYRLNPSLERRRPWVVAAVVLAALAAIALVAAVLGGATDGRGRAGRRFGGRGRAPPEPPEEDYDGYDELEGEEEPSPPTFDLAPEPPPPPRRRMRSAV